MEFSFSKMFKKDIHPMGSRVDVVELMQTFRKEVEALNIAGVDSAHLTGKDMEMWNRRETLSREDLKDYAESIKRDYMQIGQSRPNFFKYFARYYKDRN